MRGIIGRRILLVCGLRVAIVVRGGVMLMVVLLMIARVRPIGVARGRMLIVIVRGGGTRQPFGR